MAAIDFPNAPGPTQLFQDPKGNIWQYLPGNAGATYYAWCLISRARDIRLSGNARNILLTGTVGGGAYLIVGTEFGAYLKFYDVGGFGAPQGISTSTRSTPSAGSIRTWRGRRRRADVEPERRREQVDLARGQPRLLGRATTTPTPTPGAGAFTTVSCEVNYQRVGDSMEFDVSITITANGTAAAFINVPMPFTAVKECVAAGRQAAVGGQMVQGIMAATSSNLTVLLFNNTYPGATGERITLSGRAFVN
jgi:hypothetical protein